jgi:leucyl aminopeptidase
VKELQSVVKASKLPLETVDTDLLVVPISLSDGLTELSDLDRATGGELGRALSRGECTGKKYENFIVKTIDKSWSADRLMFIGMGEERPYSLSRLRQVATAAALVGRRCRINDLAFVVPDSIKTDIGVQAVVEGLTLGEFSPDLYKAKSDRDLSLLKSLQIVSGNDDSRMIENAIARGRLLGECTNLAKRLSNEPSNKLSPSELAEQALEILKGTSLKIDVLDRKSIRELGMGLLLGVAQGSVEEPRVIIMRHEPSGVTKEPVLALVGKGVTFDSGGISLKPAESMERMKEDMSGGAAVICAMRAISQLNPSIRVIGIVPTTENMPGGRAVKPGDVLSGASGTTVEVINTDAEGRLILADALWYAIELGATHLVDVATLTGGCIVALGNTTSGLFGAPDSWINIVQDIANQAGDRVWAMPVFDDYSEQLRSDIADVANVGGRPASAITAAMFLKRFAGGRPWAHLDIAGTAWNEENSAYQKKGPTGVAVRTLVELACAGERWNKIK